ncbi:GNAT family N-acetyltransferase [Nocardia sp. XZ_19_385]|uniref:GNAT family N-acetyltransferase n=1 Tax=Nocardia sp. XZ_19_385 TaxID=2769488 RepID=UPI00188F0D06|nr:N-acetyltransferase [Nocardia sp. XZ_19_385]
MDIGPGPGVVFRGARSDDLAAIIDLEHELFGHDAYPYWVLRQLFDLNGSHWVVAEQSGAIFGYAVVGIGVAPRHRCWVMTLAISKSHQGYGFGRDLLERAVANCRAALADTVYLTVRPSDPIAKSLYTACDFRHLRHEDQYFGAGEPRDVLVRELRPAAKSESADPRWTKRSSGQ